MSLPGWIFLRIREKVKCCLVFVLVYNLKVSKFSLRGNEIKLLVVKKSPCRNNFRATLLFLFCLKFRKFHMSIGRVHSGCTDPIQVTARLAIVLVSRIQKSDTGGNGPIHLLSNRNFGQNGKRVKRP